MTINYALENLLCDVTGLTSTARWLFVKSLVHISLAANQVLLSAYGFIYEDKIKIYVDFSLFLRFPFWRTLLVWKASERGQICFGQ